MLARGETIDNSEVRVFIPVSLRSEAERDGEGGNRISGFVAPLPVGEPDPLARLRTIQATTVEFKNGKAGAEKARFRRFATEALCFAAHAKLLSQTARYRPAMADADDPFVFAARIAECGYSTDPGYAKKLADLITEFKLGGYDVKPPAVKRA